MPFLVANELAGLRSAFPASRLPDDVSDGSDENEAPTGLTVVERPTDFRQLRPSLPSPIQALQGWGSDSRAHDGGLSDDAACTSFRWHRLHYGARKCGIRRPVPFLNHPKRSCMSWRPCPPLEGYLARPRLKRGRAPNLGSVFLS